MQYHAVSRLLTHSSLYLSPATISTSLEGTAATKCLSYPTTDQADRLRLIPPADRVVRAYTRLLIFHSPPMFPPPPTIPSASRPLNLSMNLSTLTTTTA